MGLVGIIKKIFFASNQDVDIIWVKCSVCKKPMLIPFATYDPNKTFVHKFCNPEMLDASKSKK